MTRATISKQTRPASTTGMDGFSSLMDSADLRPSEIKNAWRRVDPYEAALNSDASERLRFTFGLQMAAFACEQVVDLNRELRADFVYTLMTIPGCEAEAMPHINRLMQEIPDADFTEQRFNDDKCHDLFARLSLPAAQVYCRSVISKETSSGEKLQEANVLSRALLGGIIKKAVKQISAMAVVVDDHSYDTDTRKEALGRVFELMNFTRYLTEAYEQEDPTSMSVRFTTTREDRPMSGHVRPRRSFDVVVRRGNEIQLDQYKTKTAESIKDDEVKQNEDKYAEPINVVRPARPMHLLIRRHKELTDAFSTLVNGAATKEAVAAAKKRIAYYLGDAPGDTEAGLN